MFSVLNFPARVVHLIGLIAAVLVFIGPGAPNGRGAQSLHVSGRADAPVAMVRIATSGNDVTCRRGEPSKPCTTLSGLIRSRSAAISSQSLGDRTHFRRSDTLPLARIRMRRTVQFTRTRSCFRGQSRASVSINGVWIGEPWVTLTNVTLAGIAITGWDSTLGCYTNPVAYVTVSGSVIDARSTQVNPMYMANVQHITLSGTSIGNVVTGETEISNPAEAPCPHNDHLRFTGNTWHDFLNPNGARDHMECLQFDALARGTSNDNVT